MSNLKKILSVIILCFAIFPISCYADCTTTDLANYKKMAVNVNSTYLYKENNGNIKFSLIINNILDGISLIYNETKYTYSDTNDGQMVIDDLNPGDVVYFRIHANYDACAGTKLIEKSVSLPSYNSYYSDPACIGKETYSLCQKWNKNSLSYDEFIKQVNNYKIEGKTENIEINKKVESNNILNDILMFYEKYYLFILVAIICVCLILIYKYNKKNNLFK